MCVLNLFQQVTAETLQSSTHTGNKDRLDIYASFFWQTGQMSGLLTQTLRDMFPSK